MRTHEIIKERTAAAFGVEPDDLVARKFGRDIAWARQAAMWLSVKLTDQNAREVGHAFGRGWHSVRNACNAVNYRMENPEYSATIMGLYHELEEEIFGAICDRRAHER